ncbi:hypothetical protein PG994_003597 [Apiospora phragmitis]|uniref:Uncharacterized protein n=1 Tax=Apiospora phragmitis TaxID=2905665 RepID=A0ABR1W1M1_9PEZI
MENTQLVVSCPPGTPTRPPATPPPKPKSKSSGPTIISSDNDGSNGASTSSNGSRFAPLVNHSRLDPGAAEGFFFPDLGRGGYDITNSPKPAPKPVTDSPRPKPAPKPEKPQN